MLIQHNYAPIIHYTVHSLPSHNHILIVLVPIVLCDLALSYLPFEPLVVFSIKLLEPPLALEAETERCIMFNWNSLRLSLSPTATKEYLLAAFRARVLRSESWCSELALLLLMISTPSSVLFTIISSRVVSSFAVVCHVPEK